MEKVLTASGTAIVTTSKIQRGCQVLPYHVAIGPDGRRFDNTSKRELVNRLYLTYGK